MRGRPGQIGPGVSLLRGAGGTNPAAPILDLLAQQALAVWFDPDWTPGVTLADDAGTQRMTALLSRPITGQAQYTVSQGVLASAPATTTTPNGRRGLTLAGAQSLGGAAGLAALLQGVATYSEIQVVRRTSAASIIRWCAGFTGGADNRIAHLISAAGNVDARARAQAGASTINTGAALANATWATLSGTYNGASYSTWINSAASIVAAANVRAPATLDRIVLGAQLVAGALSGFWVGQLAGLVVTSALSAPNRVALEALLGDYYGA